MTVMVTGLNTVEYPSHACCDGISLSPFTQPYEYIYTHTHGCVLRPQTVYFQVKCVFVIISVDGESALHGVWIIGSTSTI